MKKEIYIYEHDADTLKFLKSFFRTRKEYSPVYLKRGADVLRDAVNKRLPAALIVSSPDGIEEAEVPEVGCPVIALISGSVTDGIRSVVKHDIEYYLMSPFQKEDLEHKLKIAIKRKSWFENLFKERKDLEALLDFTYFISSTLNPKEILFIFVKKLSEMMNVTRCSVIRLDVEEPRYAYIISASDDPAITKIKLDLEKYPEIKKAISIKRPVIIKDAIRDPLMRQVKELILPLSVRSILVVPVIFRDEVIGTLLLRTVRSDRSFTRREVELCTTIAHVSANAFYNAFLYDRLETEKRKFERLAVIDYLTGIYNIRYFYGRLEEEFSRADRYAAPLSCIMIDIDHFKKVNDTYGHRIGDIVLREFAQLVRGRTRKSDIFARYGGEEFILLLPQTSRRGATNKASVIRKIVKEHQFMGLRKSDTVTVSIGISCFPDKRINTYDDLITFADDALFIAKKKGRDQIVISPSS